MEQAMKNTRTRDLIVAALVGALGVSIVNAQESFLDGNISLASETKEYTFKRGYPTGNTAEHVYQQSDLRRAIEAYKTFLPTMATEAVIQQMMTAGAEPNEIGIVMAQGPRQQFAATNSDTPYSLTTLDLKKAGPMVVEMPPNPLLIGLVNDRNMRWIADIGSIGPEKGKGGKHLFLPPGFDGEIPKGYYLWHSKTWKLVIAVRTVPLDGDVKKSIRAVHKIMVYPLSKVGERATHRYLDVSDKRLPLPLLAWEGRLEFWRQLHAVIQEENPQVENRYTLGALAELGIVKGQPFKPNARAEKILKKAAEIAHAELSISLYANRRPSRITWNDRRWETAPVGPFHAESGDFGSTDAIDLDASDHYFFCGWGTSSSIGRQKVGSGSLYFLSFRDTFGAYFDGGSSYKMTIPAPVPAGLFWSTTVYDAETRCLIETDLNRAAVRSHLDRPQANVDGSYDIFFGPKAPEGKKVNWVQTIPGKGWFPMVRLYGPKKEAFDGTWKLGDIGEIKSN
jgi:hypothetical protein